jgi:protein TonB
MLHQMVISKPRGVGSWLGVGPSLVVHVAAIASGVLWPVLRQAESPAVHPLEVWIACSPALAKPVALAPKPQSVRPARDRRGEKPALTLPAVPEPRMPESAPAANPLPTAPDPAGAGGGEQGSGGEAGVAAAPPQAVPRACVDCERDIPVLDYDKPPRAIRVVPPAYPSDAFERNVEGTVVLEVLVDSHGRVLEARVLSSIPALDAAALEIVRQWLFSPAVKNGIAVTTIVRAPVTFRRSRRPSPDTEESLLSPDNTS